jgi:hypothetical protein
LENKVYPLVEETSRGATYHDWLLLTDSNDEVIDHLVKHAQAKKLPLISDFESLKSAFWMKHSK